MDGNTYQSVIIGTQMWFTSNLKVTQYDSSTPIQNITNNIQWSTLTDGAYCYYSNNAGNSAVYGALYNWFAALSGNLCPTGWRVPTDIGWHTLERIVDPTIPENDVESDRGTDGGLKLKSVSGWFDNGNGTHAYNFNGLGGGFILLDGTFSDQLDQIGSWWTNTQSDATLAYTRSMAYNSQLMGRNGNYKINGYSIRCIKDVVK